MVFAGLVTWRIRVVNNVSQASILENTGGSVPHIQEHLVERAVVSIPRNQNSQLIRIPEWRERSRRQSVNSRLALGFSCKKCFLAPLSGLLTIIFLVACGHLAFGQQTLGSINGEVTDSSGAVIQRAQVKARATATNLEVTATTKADGSFNIADLPIGTYEVKF